jgi:hypothetical protein
LKFEKKESHTVVILLVLNEPVGRLVNAQSILNCEKKFHLHDAFMFHILKEFSGKLVNCQLELNHQKKQSPTVVILLVLNEPVGRLVICQLLLK